MLRLKLALARLARAMSRRLGRGGGTTLPGRLLLRLDKHAIGRLGQRLEAGTALLSATNGKTTTASMIAGILERGGRPVVRNAAGSNMHWGIATALIDAGREPRRARPVRGRRGVAAGGRARAAAATRSCSATCSATSSTATASSSCSPTAGRSSSPSAPDRRAFVLNADDPLVADLGRERAGRRLLRHRGRLAGAARAPARRRLEALPQLRHAVRLRGGLPRPPRPLPLPELRQASGRSRDVVAERIELDGMAGSRISLRTPAGTHRAPPPPPRALQRLQRGRGRRGRDGARRAARRREGVARGADGGVRARRDDPGRGPRRLDPAGEEPGRRERGAAHAHARGAASSTCGSR